MALSAQVVGNVGLYFVCYQLSLRGWNVMPTARNARGVDIVAYNHDCSRLITIQVKTLSQRAPVPLGTSLDRVMGDYWIIVNQVVKEPTAFVMMPDEVRRLAHRGEKEGRVSFWLQPGTYDVADYRSAWNRIGDGSKAE